MFDQMSYVVTSKLKGWLLMSRSSLKVWDRRIWRLWIDTSLADMFVVPLSPPRLGPARCFYTYPSSESLPKESHDMQLPALDAPMTKPWNISWPSEHSCGVVAWYVRFDMTSRCWMIQSISWLCASAWCFGSSWTWTPSLPLNVSLWCYEFCHWTSFTRGQTFPPLPPPPLYSGNVSSKPSEMLRSFSGFISAQQNWSIDSLGWLKKAGVKFLNVTGCHWHRVIKDIVVQHIIEHFNQPCPDPLWLQKRCLSFSVMSTSRYSGT